jgi:hypothetical protein
VLPPSTLKGTWGGAKPKPDFQVPEEKMSRHACKNMVMPAPEFPDLIVIHTQFRFGFFKT